MTVSARNAGLVERWYVARSRAGTPPLVHIGFWISLDQSLPLEDVRARCVSALNGVVRTHPWLRARLVDWDTPTPKIVLDPSQDLTPDQVLRIVRGGDVGAALGDLVIHDCALDGPLFRGLLWVPDSESKEDLYRDVFVGLTVHHSIADGLSVVALARTLVLLLNEPKLQLPAHSANLSQPIEEMLDVQPSVYTLASTVFNSLVNPFVPKAIKALYSPRTTTWKGVQNPPGSVGQRHRLLQIPPNTVNGLLAFAKQNGLTFNTVFHTSLVIALSPLISTNEHIQSVTAASLASRVGKKASDGGCYVTAIPNITPKYPYPSSVEEFLSRCRDYASDIQSEKNLEDNIQKWGIVGKMSVDFLTQHLQREMANGQTKDSISFSNVRVVSFTDEEVKGGWRPTNALFTMAHNGPLAALDAYIISLRVQDEIQGTTVSLGWEEGVLRSEDVEGLINGMQKTWEWLLKTSSV